MRYWILLTILDGEYATTLHASKDEAERELISTVGEIAGRPMTTVEEVQAYFDEQGIGWRYELTETEPVVIDFSAFRQAMTESEFHHLWSEAQQRFGYSGTFFSRGDAEQHAQDSHSRALTDEEWEAVQESWYWYKGLPEQTTERGWELVASAVDESLKDN